MSSELEQLRRRRDQLERAVDKLVHAQSLAATAQAKLEIDLSAILDHIARLAP